MSEFDTVVEIWEDYLQGFFIRLLISLIIFVIARYVIKVATRVLAASMEAAKIDKSVTGFAVSVARWAMNIILAITIFGQMRLDTGTFSTLFVAALLAVSFALQDTLAHFAAGVQILTLQPIKLGQLVEVNDTLGVVKAIEGFQTHLVTLDGKWVYVPNSHVTSNIIVNYSEGGPIRLDIVVDVADDADIDLAMKVCEEAMMGHPLVQELYRVGVEDTYNSTVKVFIGGWVDALAYFTTRFEVVEHIKKMCDKKGIEIVFPQRDAHLDFVDAATIQTFLDEVAKHTDHPFHKYIPKAFRKDL